MDCLHCHSSSGLFASPYVNKCKTHNKTLSGLEAKVQDREMHCMNKELRNFQARRWGQPFTITVDSQDEIQDQADGGYKTGPHERNLGEATGGLRRCH